MNLALWLQRAASAFPGRPAVFLGERVVWTYGDWAARSARLAHGLREQLGLQPGERVALFMRNQPEYLLWLYAAWWAGLCVVPVNAKLHPEELHHVLQDSGAALLVMSDDLAPEVQGHLAGRLPPHLLADGAQALALQGGEPWPLTPREGGDLAWLFYTSGTTGRPKGVMLTHRNLRVMTACYFSDVHAAQAEDSSVYCAPLSHGAGMYHLPFMVAAARHVIPDSAGFEPAELVRLSQLHGRVCGFFVPTMVKRLAEHVERTGDSPDGFLTLVYGGGPMYLADIERALQLMGPRFAQIYGQGETPMCATALSKALLADRAHPDWAARAASVGLPQSAVEIRVADATGAPLPVGEIGEVLVRGDSLMAGYWRNPEASSSALRDGWLWTGDMGSLDAQGFLTLKDRSKDLVISGGSNIYPREVEEVLLRHPQVAEVACVGLPDAEWGEVLVACVVAAGARPAPEAELDALCLATIARFKRPKRYVFLTELPKNAYGKVLKTTLRQLLKDKP
jgi:long-chain acyl-CoA synthetase